MDIAIIGAGIAGLSLAHLIQHKHQVHLFEQSSRPGGRVTDISIDDVIFDQGAQFFTAKSPQFKQFLQSHINQALIQHWPARFVEIDGDQMNNVHTWQTDYPHYVACPGMQNWPQSLAENLDISFNTEIIRSQHIDHKWILTTAEHTIEQSFDSLVTAVPAAIAKQLVPSHCQYYKELSNKTLVPCYSLMVILRDDIQLEWDAALIRHKDISWISVNSSKPERNQALSLLVHSTNLWAQQHYELDDDLVKQHLLNEMLAVTGIDNLSVGQTGLHRWQYANIPKQYGQRSLRDEKLNLVSIGDWCIKGRVESAFLSAEDASRYFINIT